jgi:hypothetical protein
LFRCFNAGFRDELISTNSYDLTFYPLTIENKNASEEAMYWWKKIYNSNKLRMSTQEAHRQLVQLWEQAIENPKLIPEIQKFGKQHTT